LAHAQGRYLKGLLLRVTEVYADARATTEPRRETPDASPARRHHATP